MGVLILSANGRAYTTARALVAMGVPVAFYRKGDDTIGLDELDVVHVSSWRPHVSYAQLVVVDDPTLLLAYRAIKHPAPVLYHSADRPAVSLPPEAGDYLLHLALGQQQTHRRRWWHLNGK